MTVLAQVKTSADDFPRPGDWQPWVNCEGETEKMLVGLIAHRFVRDRGGLLPGERLNLYVYTHWPQQRKHPNGTPVEVRWSHVVVEKTDPVQATRGRLERDLNRAIDKVFPNRS